MLCATETLKSEVAYTQGLVIAIDIKDSLDGNIDTDIFTKDEQIEDFVLPDIRKFRENFIEPDVEFNPNKLPYKKLLTEEEFEEDLTDELIHLAFYRCTEIHLPQTEDELFKLLQKNFFFPPMYVWFRQELISIS